MAWNGTSRVCPWQMPQLSTQHLHGREELHLAHLVLSFITMGYLWQEGEEGTVKVKTSRSKFTSSLGSGAAPLGLILWEQSPFLERDPYRLAPFT